MSTGIKITNCTNAKILNNYVEGFENGIAVEDSDDIDMKFNNIVDTTNPISAANTSRIYIESNTINSISDKYKKLHLNDKKILAKDTKISVHFLNSIFDSERKLKIFLKDNLVYFQILSSSITISSQLSAFVGIILNKFK